MNENLNLIELLKDCPKGTKLYSKCLGVVEFNKVIQNRYIEIVDNSGCFILYRYNGKLKQSTQDAEIDLFPSKDQRDWSKWHSPFVKGDVLVSEAGNIVLCSHIDENQLVHYHCILGFLGTLKIYNGVDVGYSYECTLANDSQKQKLFDALKKEGYGWNPETKTLEKLKKEKSDIKTCLNCNTFKVMHQNCPYSPIWTYKDLNVAKIHLNDETNCEFWREIPETHILENIKFDPKTLQPFDRVVVRDFDNQKWMACLFSHIENGAYHKFKTVDGLGWHQCIPFNNDTKHLVGKMDKAPEFYKYWED